MGEQKRRGMAQPTAEERAVIDDAIALAQAIETLLTGHDGRSCVLAIGWALGAYAADHSLFGDLDLVIAGFAGRHIASSPVSGTALGRIAPSALQQGEPDVQLR